MVLIIIHDCQGKSVTLVELCEFDRVGQVIRDFGSGHGQFYFSKKVTHNCEFVATHTERVICSSLGFAFVAQKTIFAPLELFLMSCSSSLLS